MNLTNIKATLTYKDIPVTLDIGGEEFAFNIHTAVSRDKMEEFVNIAVAEFLHDGTLHHELIEPAIDFASIAIFTDIDMSQWSRSEAHALMYATDILQLLDRNVNASFYYYLRGAATQKIDYYLELARPQSHSEEAYEALAELIGKLNRVMDTLVEKVSSFDVSEEDIQSLAQSLKRLESVDDDKILELVMNKES